MTVRTRATASFMDIKYLPSAGSDLCTMISWRSSCWCVIRANLFVKSRLRVEYLLDKYRLTWRLHAENDCTCWISINERRCINTASNEPVFRLVCRVGSPQGYPVDIRPFSHPKVRSSRLHFLLLSSFPFLKGQKRTVACKATAAKLLKRVASERPSRQIDNAKCSTGVQNYRNYLNRVRMQSYKEYKERTNSQWTMISSLLISVSYRMPTSYNSGISTPKRLCF